MKDIKYTFTIAKENLMLGFYQKLAVLDALEYKMEKILDDLGIDKIIIYGDGMIGNILREKLRKSGKIHGVCDIKYKQIKNVKNADILTIEQMREEEYPIIVTPILTMKEITLSLIKKGISRKRIISLNLIIDWAYENCVNHVSYKWKYGEGNKVFLVSGASFKNKGAQSMLFVAVNEMRKRYPGCEIYFLPENSIKEYENERLDKYFFRTIWGGWEKTSDLYDVLPITTAIIDISGYAVTSETYNKCIREMLKNVNDYDLPLYMMPQSFGPFEFEEEEKNKFASWLAHAKVIYAREEKGYLLLKETFGLNNVKRSVDLVLQNRGIDYKNIYVNEKCHEQYVLESKENVGIIPNIRNYEFGDKKQILNMYKSIIETLIEAGKKVYILEHSNDNKACEDIYKMYMFKENVYYCNLSLDCFQFSNLIRNFQFVIASRYHSIVHALKEGVPCIAIGWEVKYEDVLSLFEQEQYCFNVRKGIEVAEIVDATKRMIEKYSEEKQKIIEKISYVQQENCFDVLGE